MRPVASGFSQEIVTVTMARARAVRAVSARKRNRRFFSFLAGPTAAYFFSARSGA